MYIKKFSVQNYRSLENVSLSGLSPQVIFFGDNDTGKSNILAFLELLFQRKYTIDTTVTSTDSSEGKRLSEFWLGYIDDFSDNFYYGNDAPIKFNITICYSDTELEQLPTKVRDSRHDNQDEHVLKFSGEIRRTDFHSRAEINLTEVEFNSKTIFDGSKPDTDKYLPEFGLSKSAIIRVFEQLMNPLNDSFLRIPANRFMKRETEKEKGEQETILTAETFKNWLFSISLERDKERVYQDIIEQFNSPPFEKGRLSIARLQENVLEVFVEDKDNHKLPIGRKGTGVQQILIVLAYLAQSKAPFVGIEEIEINLSPQTQKSIFDMIIRLMKLPKSQISQIFLPTHSQIIATRKFPGATIEQRQVTIEEGKTVVEKRTDENITDFFNPV